MPTTRITVVTTGFNYDHIRVHRPLAWPGVREALWDSNIIVEVKPAPEITLQSLANTDHCVFHGVGSPAMMNLLRKIPCRFSIFEDDLMRIKHLPEWNPNRISACQEQVLDYMLEHAAVIVATTEPLAAELGHLGKTIVMPNLEDFPAEEMPDGASDRMDRAIGVMGNSHAGDIELLNKFDWSGKTVIWSSCLPSSWIAAHRDKMGNMTFRPSRPNVGHISPTASYEEYATWLRNIAPQFGIGLAPLVPCLFNSCKSILRFLEYTRCGWVSVMSAAQPYSMLPADVCVKVLDDVGCWSRAVEYAAKHPEIAKAAWRYCREHHSYQTQWQRWVNVYQRIGAAT